MIVGKHSWTFPKSCYWKYHFEDTRRSDPVTNRWALSSGVDDESKSSGRMDDIRMSPKREQLTMLTNGGVGGIAVLSCWILIRAVRKR